VLVAPPRRQRARRVGLRRIIMLRSILVPASNLLDEVNDSPP
jgi:hypothetical protein